MDCMSSMSRMTLWLYIRYIIKYVEFSEFNVIISVTSETQVKKIKKPHILWGHCLENLLLEASNIILVIFQRADTTDGQTDKGKAVYPLFCRLWILLPGIDSLNKKLKQTHPKQTMRHLSIKIQLMVPQHSENT